MLVHAIQIEKDKSGNSLTYNEHYTTDDEV